MDKKTLDLRNSHFYCPITEEVMMDPVVDPEGNSYERNAIIAWLKQNSNSPITRSPLRIDQLIPNRSLRKAIEDEIANGTLARSNARSDSKHESKTVEEIGPSGLKSSPEPLDPVRLTITSGGLVSEVSDDGSVAVRVMTSIIPPDSSTRCPADVVCVVDVSGSMGGNASLPGATEFSGLSLLDIVKHALKTIINTLQPDDRFALISYSDVAKVVFCLTPLNGAGKARALSLIESLEPDGLTNLWDGLLKGMDVLAASRSPAADIRNCCLLLLTDGVPNVEPPRGHLPMLKRYKDSHGGCYPGTISTFGFGYNLKSALLKDIAVEGGGMYAFIPDSGFVGTAFVNALSNQLVSFGTQAFLSLEWQNGAVLDDERDVIGNPNCSFASWGTNIDIGNLHYGQRRDFVVRLKVPRDLVTSSDCLVSATLKYKTLPVNDGSVAAVPGTDEVILTSEIWDNSPQQHVEAEVQWLRCRLVDFISERMDEGVSPNSPADSVLAQEMRTWLHAHALGKRDVDEGKAVARVEGLLQDLTGQITEAVSKEQYFCRWGMHYLPSLQRAHALQQCNNFKDPGIQFYGGSLFTSVRDVADDVFCSMPPPQPAVTQYSRRLGGSSGSSSTQAVTSMRSYHDANAPCFPSFCKVAMADGSLKQVGDIKKGDLVVCPDVSSTTRSEVTAPVECVVKTQTVKGHIHLVTLHEGLVVTPWHPVNINGEWKFPMDVCTDFNCVPCTAVYSFVLGPPSRPMGTRRGPTMIIDGVACITLAHGMPRGDAVVSHEFYGTERVVVALRAISNAQYEGGLVSLVEGCVQKDPVTGRACGFRTAASLHVDINIEDVVNDTQQLFGNNDALIEVAAEA